MAQLRGRCAAGRRLAGPGWALALGITTHPVSRLAGPLVTFLALQVLAPTPGGAIVCPTAAPCGALDVANGSFIAGWAQDDDYPGPIMVHIYVDDVLVHTVLADGCRPDVGCHGFHWNHSPFGAGNHRVVVYAIGTDASGAPDGSSPALDGSPKYFDVGCAGLTTDAYVWCNDNPGYWVTRQPDTRVLFGPYVGVGIDNSYGGAITQLYTGSKSHNLVSEHGGGMVQLSLWGYDSQGPNAWFANDGATCDPTRYPSREACLAAHPECTPGPGRECCRLYGASNGAHVADCVAVRSCWGWGAGAPWNPIQAQAANCEWGGPTNDVTYMQPTLFGGWLIRKDGPYHYTKTSNFPEMTFTQAVHLGEANVKVDYTIDYAGPYTTGNHAQEIPALFTANGISAKYFYYGGPAPYGDAASPVTVVVAPTNPQFTYRIGLPAYAVHPNKAELPYVPEAQATESWWGVCSEDESRCLTVAIFSDVALYGALARTASGAGYLTPIGVFNFFPAMQRTLTVHLFPYKWDAVIAGKSVRQRIFELHCPSGCC
jgi:hypothetical protein